MKKRIMKVVVLLMVLIIPVLVYAVSIAPYGESVTKTNNYINKFSDRNKFLTFNKNYVYEKGGFGDSIEFTSGGMLSKSEYDLSIDKNQSYLATGKEYWTLTSDGTNNKYYIDSFIQSKSQSSKSGTRVTQYIKPGTVVSGKGTFANPWTFDEGHEVEIKPNNSSFGSVSPNETKYVKTGTSLEYVLTPIDGYFYNGKKDDCHLVKKGVDIHENTYVLSNIDRDIYCTAVFELRTYKFSLNIGNDTKDYKGQIKTYSTNPGYNPIYYKHKKDWYSDANTTNAITKINVPVITGWTFEGYYFGSTKIIDSNGDIINKNLPISDFVITNQTATAQLSKNTFTISYNLNGGTAGSKKPTSSLYDEVIEIDNPTKAGYSFAGWSFNGNSTTAKYGDTSTNVNSTFTANSTKAKARYFANLNPTKNASVTLTANWESCPAGTYNDGSSTTCAACGAGKYSLEGASSCINIKAGCYGTGGTTDCPNKCAAGTYSTAGSATCTPCAAGTYSASEGSSTCSACGAGKWSAEGSSTCSNINAGCYGTSATTACPNKCPAGKYSAAGSASCTNCAAGTYSSNEGSATCTSCGAGKYSGEGSATCSNISAGCYGTSGTSACPNKCPAGKYSNAGSASCTDCGAGKYSGEGSATCSNINAGCYGTSASTACPNKCNAGYYSAAGSASCSKCTAGTYSGQGASTCTACGAGKYSGEGSAACSNISAGCYGTSASTACPNKCNAGYYSSAGSASCSKCTAGTYSGQGASTCTACGAGKYSGEGSAACSNISAGCYGTSAATACPNKCAAGTYSASGSASCSKCSAGYFSGEGASTCTKCGTGTYSANEGSATCTACPKGTYNASLGATSCASCPSGSYNNQTNQTSCTQCPKGMYCTGGTNTTVCPDGTYRATTGGKVVGDCTKCQAGYEGTGTGKTSEAEGCSKCAKGSYSAAGAGSCSLCAAGTYTDQVGQSTCKTCAAGYYNTGTGNTGCSLCDDGYFCTGGSNKTICPQNYRDGTAVANKTAQNKCLNNVAAGYRIASANAAETPCDTGYYSTAHSVTYGSISTCTQCPAGYRDGTAIGNKTSQSVCLNNVAANRYVKTAGADDIACDSGYESTAHTVLYGGTSSCIINNTCPGSNYTLKNDSSKGWICTYPASQQEVPICGSADYEALNTDCSAGCAGTAGCCIDGIGGGNVDPSACHAMAAGCSANPCLTACGTGDYGTITMCNGTRKINVCFDNLYYSGSIEATSGNAVCYIPANSAFISFDANGGEVNAQTRLLTKGSTYGTLPTPTRNEVSEGRGYAFSGWYTAASGGTRVTNNSVVGSESLTLYAHWGLNWYCEQGNIYYDTTNKQYRCALPSFPCPFDASNIPPGFVPPDPWPSCCQSTDNYTGVANATSNSCRPAATWISN